MTQRIVVRENGRPRVQTLNEEPSKTVQADRHQASMRHILAKYEAMGIVDHMAKVDLAFRDVHEFTDFSELMQQTKVAEQAFMELPSKLREVFNHSVEEWLDVAHSPERLEELRPKLEALGVLDPLPQPEKEAPPPASSSADGGDS